MGDLIIFLLSLAGIACTLPGTVELLFLTFGAQLHKYKNKNKQTRSGKLAVIIPAHNEAAFIQHTIQSLKKQGNYFDIIVVADNCTDQTAQIAKNQHVKVFERKDLTKRGKPWALKYIFNILMKENYDWFVIVDGDSIVQPNFIQEVCAAFANGAKAIQTRYEVLSPEASIRHRLMHVAFSAMNYVRPLGRSHWNLSCGILGNGFGITKEVLQHVPFPVGSVVEDLSFHLNLVEHGYKVIFVPSTSVYGEIPTSQKGIATQRIRWEGGRFLELGNIGKLFSKIVQGNKRLIEPALDLLLLPLAYHTLLLLLLLLIPNAFVRGYALLSLAVIAYHLAVSIYLGKGGYKDVFALLAAPFYLVWKVGILFKTFATLSRGIQWQKTERTAPEKEKLLSPSLLWIALGMAVCLGLLWQFSPLEDASARLQKLPLKGIGYQGKDLPLNPNEATFLKGANVIKREYTINDRNFFITVLDGTKNRHLVHDPYYCFKGSGWEVVGEKPFSLENGIGNLLEIQKGNEKRQALFWFSDSKSIYHSPYGYWWQTTLRRLTFGLSGPEPLLIVVQPLSNEPINWQEFSKAFYSLFQI